MAGITLNVNAQTEAAAQQIQALFGQLAQGMEKVSGASSFLGEIAGQLAAAFTVGAIVDFTEKAIESEAALDKLAQKTGLSVETLSALQATAEKSKVSFEELNVSLGMFSDKIFSALKTGGDLAKIFRDLGVSLTDDYGKILPVNQILQQVMDKFKAMPDGPQKTYVAMELFGRSGRELIPILNQGAEGLRKMRDEAEAGGTLVTAKQSKEALEFEEQIASLKLTLSAMWREVANGVLPTLKDLVTWLQNAQRQSGALSDFASGLVDLFKGISVVVLFASTNFMILGTNIGGLCGIVFNQLIYNVQLVIQLFGVWVNTMKSVVDSVIQLGTGVGQLGQVMLDFSTGQFSKAMGDASQGFDKIGEASVSASKIVVSNLNTASKAVADFAAKSWGNFSSVAEDTMTRDLLLMQGFADSMQNMFDKKPSSPHKGRNDGTDGNKNDQSAPVSDEASKLLDQIDKAYAQATQGKIALLDQEEAALRRKLDIEVTDEELHAQAVYELTKTYAAKRQAVYDEQAKKRLANLQAQQALVESDSNLGLEEQAEKLKVVLAAINSELNEQISRQTELTQSSNEDVRLKAEQERLGLMKQQLDVQKQMRNLTFSGAIRNSVTDMIAQWGTLAKQVAQTISGAINTAVSSVSHNLTGVIMGTETWKQALTNIADDVLSSIIEGIIRMALQWIVSQTMMALFGQAQQEAQLLGVAVQSDAITALMAPAAIMTDIATDGEASAMAPIEVWAAAAFSKGGYTGDGAINEPAGVVHRGEYVIPAPTLNRFGVGFFDNLDNIVSGGFVGQVPSQGLAQPRSSASTAAAPQVHVVYFNSAPAYKQWMQSEGVAHVLHIVKEGKRSLGLKT